MKRLTTTIPLLLLDEYLSKQAGHIIATGITESTQLHIIPARWVAVKNHDGTWTIKFHETKHTPPFVKSFGAICTSMSAIRELVPCSDEVFAKYRYI